MTKQQIKREIIKALKVGVYFDKDYTMTPEKIEAEANIIMEELGLIYKLSNVQEIRTARNHFEKDNEFNYINYDLIITLDFGCWITSTHNVFICFKAE